MEDTVLQTKLCECGCGQAAPIAKQTDTKQGYVKGQPKRFIHGHYKKSDDYTVSDPPDWYDPNTNEGFCHCGCGEPTLPAAETSRDRGTLKGQSQRYINGHGFRASRRPLNNPSNYGRRGRRNRQHVLDYLKTHHCVDCGESNVFTLEFDHVRGEKKGNISTMAGTSRSLRAINEEIAKCDVVCANCHNCRTGERQGWYRDLDI